MRLTTISVGFILSISLLVLVPCYIGCGQAPGTTPLDPGDGSQGGDDGTVVLGFGPGNNPPIANDQSVSATSDGSSISIVLVGGDPDGDSLTYQIIQEPSHGTLAGEAPDLTYTPDAGYVGSDTIKFVVNDGTVDSAEGTVSISVSLTSPTNRPPVAVNDDVELLEDWTLPAGRPLLNDSDPDGDSISVISFTQPEHGELIHVGYGIFRYVPEKDFNGKVSFEYTISDGRGGSDTATVTIDVLPVNDAPTAVDDAALVLEGHSLTASPLLNDTDPDGDTLTVASFTFDPNVGTLAYADDEKRDLTFTPVSDDWNGTFTFTYRATDGKLESEPATVTLTVLSVNDAPTIEPNVISWCVAPDSQLADNAREIVATDIDGDTVFTWRLAATAGEGAQVQLSETTGSRVTVNYQPPSGFEGVDSFEVEVSDGKDGVATCVVNVYIGGYPIGGVVRDYAGQPCAGVPVLCKGDPDDPNWAGMDFELTSGADGSYLASVPAGWSGTVTSNANYRFDPACHDCVNVDDERFATGQDVKAFRNYYVATDGDDGNSGLASEPFASIRDAFEECAPGDTVVIRPGTYYQKVDIKNNMGVAGAPITIRSENWYEGVAHDRAIDVIISREGTTSSRCMSIFDTEYLIVKGITFEYANGNNLTITNCHHIDVEDCITRRGETMGLVIGGSNGTHHINIRRIIIAENGNSGSGIGSKDLSQGPVHDILVEDSDAYGNGEDKTEFGGGFSSTGDKTGTIDPANITARVTFRRCLSYHNYSSCLVTQDTLDFTLEDSMAWHTTTIGDADGRGIVLGLHEQGGNGIVRRCVSFDHPRSGIYTEQHVGPGIYHNTVFDNGFQRVGETPPTHRDGILLYSEGAICVNNCAFDNEHNVYGDPNDFVVNYESRDFVYAPTTTLPGESFYSDYNFIMDGRFDRDGEIKEGPHSLSGDPGITNKAFAKQLADGYANASMNGTVTYAMRQQFMADMADALRPAPGSPLIDAATFFLMTTGTGTSEVIPVDADPKRFFRVGDTIQIDDGDGQPATKIRATVVSMSANSITVDQPVTFGSNVGVHTVYEGNGPDIGAFEAQ